MSRILSRLSVRNQVSASAALAFVGFALVGGLLYVSETTRSTTNQALAHAETLRTTLTELDSQLLQARREEKDFLLRKKEEYAGRHDAVATRITAEAKELVSQLGDSADRMAAEKVLDGAASYVAQFRKLATEMRRLGLTEGEGLEGAMRDAVHAIEKRLETIGDLQMSVSMLQMRRHEKDYIARHDRKYVEAMRNEAARLSSRVAASSLDAGEKAAIAQDLRKYQEAFAQYVEGAEREAAESSALSTTFRQLEPLADDLEKRITSRIEKVRSDGEQTLSRVRDVLIWGLAIIALCTIGLAAIIARGVSRPMTAIERLLSGWAEGDLTRRIADRDVGTLERIASDANRTADRLAETLSRVAEASGTVGSAASEIAAGSADLSARTEQQASNLEETAASMEELSATVRQNSENAQQANQLATTAREAADRGGKVTTQAVEAMTRIEGASQKISDIIGVIDEIAFQTNLLALNAAVEAARAGEAGKGFAVVASEVRTLAQRSAQASKEIKGLILDSGNQVKDGVKLVHAAGEALEGIVGSVKKVADIVSEIAAASAEQASGVEQVNSAVTQMDEMTQKNAALVEESAAAARSLEEQAAEMTRLMAFFSTGQEGARAGVRPTGNPVVDRALAAAETAPKPAAPIAKRRAAGGADWKQF